MKTEITEAEVLETNELSSNSELATIIQESGLEKSKADRMLTQFQDYFKIAYEWEQKAATCVVTDRSQTTEMKMAREGRLFLKNKRVEVEKTRKELKEQSLREGKAIDGVANILKALIVPIEEKLESYERFAEIEDAKIESENKSRREEQLLPYNVDLAGFDLGKMSEETFQSLLETTKKRHEERIEAERRAEEERIAREKAEAEEREMQRQENERLKREAEAREKQLEEERAKAEAERKALEEKARLEREAIEKKAAEERAAQEEVLRKEREEKARLEAEIKAKAEAEAKEKAEREAKEKEEMERIEAEQKAKLLAPDKDKLLQYAQSILSVPAPELSSKEANIIADSVKGLLAKVDAYIKEQAAKL